MSGFQTSGFRTSESQSTERPDRLISDVLDQNRLQTGFGLERLKSGHNRPDFRRSVIERRPITGRCKVNQPNVRNP